MTQTTTVESARRSAVIRAQLIGFDWHRHGLSAVAETSSYDWAYELTDGITEALRGAGFRFDGRFGTEEEL
jgi:hypothetical protein